MSETSEISEKDLAMTIRLQRKLSSLYAREAELFSQSKRFDAAILEVRESINIVENLLKSDVSECCVI